MPVNKNNSGFVKQAGILIAAGIICRIIGVLYRSPLTGIIGDEGNGYYTSAYNIYTIILLVSSYSIPSASSKVIAQRLALKEYRNAQRIFLCTLIYVIIVGGIASLITFWGAGWLVDENAKIVLRVFAPVIFLSGLLGVLRGYFQAHQTMLQTSVSQIIEQLLNAVVSIGAAYLLVNSITYNKASRAIYGAAGSAIGTGVGVLAALIFMCYIYILNRKIIRKRIRYDSSKNIEPYRRIFMEIILLVTPVIMSTFLYNFNISLNQTIFRIMLKLTKSLTETDVTTMYGIFAGKAVVIVNIPIAIASAISMAMIPSISGSYILGNRSQTLRKIDYAIRTIMIVSIPSMVGFIVLSKPIVLLLFPQKETFMEASNLLRYLSVTTVFYSLSTLTNAILQSVGKANIAVVNAAVALIIQTILLVPLLIFTDLNLYCLVIVAIVYSFVMCILNRFFVRKYLGYRQEIMNTFLLPLIASVCMGIAAITIYKGMYYLVNSNAVATITSVIIAATLYFVIIIRIGVIREEELVRFPKGYLLVKLLRKK